MMGSILFICAVSLGLFGLFAICFGFLTSTINMVYCALGVILYGIYLVYDI
jgi:hypothetical protein